MKEDDAFARLTVGLGQNTAEMPSTKKTEKTAAAATEARQAAPETPTRDGTRRDVLVDMGHGPVPLYQSIKLELIRAISGGKVQAGMALPTEKELSERYNVSIGTVRRAMADLVAEKVLVRQQGRGTFLAPFDSARMLNSFWHIVRKDGEREIPIVQTLRFEESKAGARTAERLKIRTGDPVYDVLNVMLLGGEPTLLDALQIPKALFPTLTHAQFVKRDSTIYDLYRDGFGVTVARTVDQLSSVPADAVTAKKLDIALGTPLLEIVRVAYTFENQPVELRRSLLHTEKYEFVDETGGSRS
ncbi:GntR family transcriptional regulator [Variovorax defluvii]|uniref:GntR family transcriptional regulator n=1 Tax=Variovorax defluvii TaxID=913761 RepID=A0ABP8I0Y7_9BURK